MNKLITILTIVIAASPLLAQYNSGKQAIGLKLGDPVGITYKKFSGDNGLEVTLGRTYMAGRSNKFYNTYFEDWYSSQSYAYDTRILRTYESSTPLSLQLHVLKHKAINSFDGHELEDGLYWYYGFGGQFRYQTIRYVYDYRVNQVWTYGARATATNLDVGADGVAGLSYTFADYPIELFLDLTLFVELIDNPFTLFFQPGIGGRYLF